MAGWRTKLIFLLIVYFAGFATAIYCLAPVPEQQACSSGKDGFVYSALKSDEFAQSFNRQMHRCIDYGKGAAIRAGEFIKQKLNENRTDS